MAADRRTDAEMDGALPGSALQNGAGEAELQNREAELPVNVAGSCLDKVQQGNFVSYSSHMAHALKGPASAVDSPSEEKDSGDPVPEAENSEPKRKRKRAVPRPRKVNYIAESGYHGVVQKSAACFQ
eukprot:gene27863-34423_t